MIRNQKDNTNTQTQRKVVQEQNKSSINNKHKSDREKQLKYNIRKKCTMIQERDIQGRSVLYHCMIEENRKKFKKNLMGEFCKGNIHKGKYKGNIHKGKYSHCIVKNISTISLYDRRKQKEI